MPNKLGSLAEIGDALSRTSRKPSLVELDGSWDSAQRRLFHRVAAGVDSEDTEVRAAADRLSAQILAGTGVAQTQYDFDAEVDFGLNQIALTQAGGALAADAKKLKLGDALADVEKATEALAKGIGRGTGDKRRPPSRKLRSAIAECAASFNADHEISRGSSAAHPRRVSEAHSLSASALSRPPYIARFHLFLVAAARSVVPLKGLGDRPQRAPVKRTSWNGSGACPRAKRSDCPLSR